MITNGKYNTNTADRSLSVQRKISDITFPEALEKRLGRKLWGFRRHNRVEWLQA